MRVLLDIYGDVWEKAVSKLLAEDIDESPISVKTSEKVLAKPLYWVDSREILTFYRHTMESGEVPRTALRVWMKAATLKMVNHFLTRKSCLKILNLDKESYHLQKILKSSIQHLKRNGQHLMLVGN